MIRIMLVDDEPFIRVAIRSLFSWEKHGYFIVAEASNGSDALSKLEHEDIDLLITDIKMPVTDGISLLQQVKTRFPHIKSVVLSNYEDFHLTRQAFIAGAVDYLLKGDLNEENFSALIQRLDNNYFKAASHMTSQTFSRPSFEQKVEAIQKLILGNTDAETSSALAQELDIGLPFVISSVKCFSGVPSPESAAAGSPANENLVKNTVFKIISEIAEFKLYYYAVSTEEYILFIYNNQNNSDIFFRNLRAFYDQLTSNFLIYLNKFSIIGTSQIHKEITEIPIAYQEADTMSDHIFYSSESAQYFFVPSDEKASSDNPVRKFVLSRIETIQVWIKQQDWESLSSFFSTLLDRLNENLYPSTYSKRIVTNLEFLIINELTHKFNDHKQLFTNYDELFDCTMQASHITELEKVTSNFIEEIMTAASGLYLADSSYSDIVNQAIISLQKKYQDPNTNLTSIANEINVNPSYLSRLFHQETKKTFNAYLNFLRLEHAKNLLLTTKSSISTISEKSGYNNSKYFINLFKKVEGISPSAYRNNTQSLSL